MTKNTLPQIPRIRNRKRGYLVISIICFTIAAALLLFILFGCASVGVDSPCVPESIRDAWAWRLKTGQPVRIAITNVRPGVDHAQAEAFDGDKWVPLTSDAAPVIPSFRHFGNDPYRYIALGDFIGEQIRHVK